MISDHSYGVDKYDLTRAEGVWEEWKSYDLMNLHRELPLMYLGPLAIQRIEMNFNP